MENDDGRGMAVRALLVLIGMAVVAGLAGVGVVLLVREFVGLGLTLLLTIVVAGIVYFGGVGMMVWWSERHPHEE